MAQANVIAKVSSLSGEAFARDSSGNLRRLQPGDVIREGETVVAGNGAEVVLTLADGRSLVVSERQSVTVDAEVAAEVKPDASDSALAQKNGFEKIAAALQDGEDLDALLDAEAPAAGETGPGNEGHSFVEFLRIVETVDPQSYSFGTGDRGVLNTVEGAPLMPRADAEAIVVYGPVTVDSPEVNEASPYVVFTVKGDVGQNVTLQFEDGSATGGGVDYGPVIEVSTDGGNSWTTYPGGPIANQTGEILVRTPIVNDDLAEGEETLTLVVVPEGGGAPSRGTGTIKDDSTGEIQNPKTGEPIDSTDPAYPPSGLDNDHVVSVNNVVVSESSPYAEFEVTGKPGNQITLTLNDGDAKAGDDYGPALEVSTDGGLSWSNYLPGDKVTMPGAGVILVRTPVIDDALVESDESFTLTATPVLGNTSASGTGTILDNDKPGISGIEPNGPGVTDDAVVEGNPLSYTVTLSELTTQPTTYSFTTGGSATPGADYGVPSFDNGVTYDPATGTITVPAGVGSFTVTYPTVDDSLVEAAETLTVTIDGVTGTGTILDNDKPGITGIEPNGPGVTDDAVVEGNPLSYTVTLSELTTQPTTYSFTTGGSATPGADYGVPSFDNGVTYDPATGTITVPAGVGSFTVTYPTVDDSLVEAAETLTVTIDGVTGTGTILDNDKPGISGIEPNGPGVGDDQVVEGQTLSYTVTLSELTTQPTTYSFTTGGSATPGADYGVPSFDNGVTYDPATGTITVPAGVGSFTVTYPTVDDSLVEAAETLTVTIDGVTGTGTILDNDKPGISGIEPNGPGVSDDQVVEGQTLSYTVTLSELTTQPTTYSFTTGGSATPGADYGVPSFDNGVTYDPATGTITVPAGVGSFTVTYPTIDDTDVEPNETLTLTIDGVTGTGTILDNDKPGISGIEPNGPGVSDDQVVEGQTLSYTVTLSEPTQTEVTYSFTTGGSATPGADYGVPSFDNGVTYDPTTGTITVPAGVGSFTVTYPTIDDTDVEPNETLTLTIDGVTGTGTILDNDKPGISGIEPNGPGVSDDQVVEGQTLSYTVTLSELTTQPTTYSFTTGGSATPGADYGVPSFDNGVTYDPATGTITVPAGVGSFTVSYPTIDDTDVEPNETLTLTIDGVTGTGTILDNDKPGISGIEPNGPGVSDDQVVEGQTLSYTVTLSEPTQTEVTYSFTTGGSATPGADYGVPSFDNGVTYDPTTGTITVPAGVGSFTVTYPTIDDTDVEPNETLTLTIDGVTGTGTILDNDKPGITGIEPNGPGVSDDQVVEGQTLSYTVTLSELTTQPTTYSFTTGGSATPGADYGVPSFDNGVTYDPATGTITVPAGVGSFTVSYPTIDDTDVEPNETLTLTIDGVTGTGTILDNDKPGISGIEPNGPGVSDDQVVEGQTLSYTVTLSEPTQTEVTYSFTTGGSATPGADYGVPSFDNGVTYDPATGTITVPAGVGSFTVTYPTIDDTDVEPNETLTLTIDGVTGTGTILDNDKPGISGIEPNGPGVSDDQVVEGQTLSYTVTLSEPTQTEVTYSFTTGGSATPGADYGVPSFDNGVTYDPTTGTITVPAGVGSFTVTYPTIDDTDVEPNETLTLTIDGVTGTGTILDNDKPGISGIEPNGPGVSDDQVVEGQTLSYTVTLSEPTQTEVTYSFTTGGSATSGTDYGTPTFDKGVTYDPTTQTITVPAGVGSFTVSYPTIDDTAIEGNETLILTVGGVSGTGTIIDNDFNTPPTITDATAVVSEEGLAHGLPDNNGVSDTTNQKQVIGKLAVADAQGDQLVVTLTAPVAALTSGGQAVTWSGNGSQTLIGTVGNEEAIRVTIDHEGNYQVTLSKPLDHPVKNAEDVLDFDIGVQVSDGQNLTQGKLTVVVEDDMPLRVDSVSNIVVDVPQIMIGGLQAGWVNPVFESGTGQVVQSNTDSDAYTDKLMWGTSASGNGQSGYSLVDNAAFSGSGMVVTPGSVFKLAEFTHHNWPINANSSTLDKVTMEMKMTVVIDGVVTPITFQVQLDHTETPNTNGSQDPASRDIVTLPTQDVTVQINGQHYVFRLEGFKDKSGNIVNAIYTDEEANNVFDIYGSVRSTDSLPSITGTVPIEAGADGLGAFAWGDLSSQYGTMVAKADGSYEFVLNRETRDSLQPGQVIKQTFTYTVTDKDGDTVHNTLTIDIGTPQVINPGWTITATVSEEGLPGGVPDSTGVSDTTDAATTSGALAIPGIEGALSVTLGTPTVQLTSGGVPVTWSSNGTNTLIGLANGAEVIRVTVDSQGQYQVVLSKPIDHPVKNVEDVLKFDVSLKISNGSAVSHGTLTVVVEDDAPKAVPELQTVQVAQQDTNVMLMLDVSGSMAGTRLQVMKESVITMLDQYDALGDVMVRVVTFSSSASAYQSNWVSVAEAKAYVNGLTAPGTSTNYDAALQTAMKAFADAGKIAGGKNVSYFLTDGAPNAGTDWSEISGNQTTAGIQANEEALWKGFLESNQINSFAYGMGTGATTGQMNPVAYDGVGKVDTSSVVVADIAELPPILRDSVGVNFGGNMLNGTLGSGSGIGADGGRIDSVEINGTTYGFGGTVSGTARGTYNAATNEWTISTLRNGNVSAGGKIVIDMDDGSYTYTPPITTSPFVENIGFTLRDTDGDTASSTLAISVKPATLQLESTAQTITGINLGLGGEYFGYNDNRTGVAGDDTIKYSGATRIHADDRNGGNLTTLNQIETIIEGRNGDSTLIGSARSSSATATDAVFSANKLEFGFSSVGGTGTLFSNDLGQNRVIQAGGTPISAQTGSGSGDNNLQRFLQGTTATNADSLQVTGGLGDTSDAIIRMVGYISIPAGGSYDFRITADDGYRVLIGGEEIARRDAIQSTTTHSFTGRVIDEGLQSIEVLYWDQGGHASLRIEVKASGAADSAYKVLGVDEFALFSPADYAKLGLEQLAAHQDIVESATNGVYQIRSGAIHDGDNQDEQIIGSAGRDIINGGGGNDTIDGAAGSDTLRGGAGDDLLTGGLGSDTFVWAFGDQGTAAAPARDTISDFNIAPKAAGGDVLDLRDLLVGEQHGNGTGNLTDYLHFSKSGSNTVIDIKPTGNGDVLQQITLSGVDLTANSTLNDQAIIQDLLTKGKLITD